MKKSFAVCAVLALLLVGCGSDNGLTSDLPQENDGRFDGTYFPLDDGMSWRYADGAVVLRVTHSDPTIYGPAYRFIGLLQDRVFNKTWDDKVMELHNESWRLLFDLRAPKGSQWTVEASGEMSDLFDGATVMVVSRSETVETPLDTYEGVVHLKVTPRAGLADAGITDLWFAPKAGLVKWVETTIGGPVVHELSAFEFVQNEIANQSGF